MKFFCYPCRNLARMRRDNELSLQGLFGTSMKSASQFLYKCAAVCLPSTTAGAFVLTCFCSTGIFLSAGIIDERLAFALGASSSTESSSSYLSKASSSQTSSKQSNQQKNGSCACDDDTVVANAVEKVVPAIVSVSATYKVQKKEQQITEPVNDPYEFFRSFFEKEFANRAPKKSGLLGSGFIIDAEGYIVTNNHVIDGASDIVVTIGNDATKKYPATLVGVDKNTDIALLKINAGKKLPYLTFGDSNALKVGTRVLAFGNPWEVGVTVTSGIISAKKREFDSNPNIGPVLVAPLVDFIQTDTPLNVGNSGGPLCGYKTGEVIGMNTAIITPTGGHIGIGFAIPSEIIQGVAHQLKKHGRVERGHLGVMIQQLDEKAMQALSSSHNSGILVASVTPGSAAAKSGIEAGDVIMKLNGTPVTTKHDLSIQIANTPVGTTVKLQIMRKKRIMDVDVALGKSPDAQQQAAAQATVDKRNKKPVASEIPVMGIVCSPLTDELKKQYNITDDSASGDSKTSKRAEDQGVVITHIDHQSMLYQFGLRIGDVIVSVNHETIRNMSDFREIVRKSKSSGGYIAILCRRASENLTQMVTLPVSE